MPRDLGKAKRADLSGHFPGEQAEYGSSFASFLEGSGQLKRVEDGTYLDTPAHGGNGSATEIPGLTNRSPERGTDTEVGPTAGGNGHSHDTGPDIFDTQFGESPFGGDDMMPEPAFADAELEPVSSGNGESGHLTPEKNDDTEALEPVSFEPSADTLSPDDGADEPEMLDSVPDLTSPENDLTSDDGDEQDDTDILEDPRRTRLQTVRPHTDELPQNTSDFDNLSPADSSDTGMLIAEAFAPRESSAWDGVDFDDDDEDEGKITDKINRNDGAPRDEELTSVHPRRAEVDGEKITNKVEPRRDVDPRASDPNAVVRDTVNFYNQTQRVNENKGSGGFPTISPKVVNSTQPLGLRPEEEEPGETPDLLSEDDIDSDTLRPGPAIELDIEETFGPDDEPSLTADAPLSLDAEPSLSAETVFDSLSAEADLDEADKRETDKFKQEDREPPQSMLPEGTDKVDKEQVARERLSARTGEPVGLQPLADEKVAAGKDTQRFYVAEILSKKPPSGDTTAELAPAEEGPPPLADSSADTSPEFGTETSRKAPARRKARRADIEDLPTPSEVNTDFLEQAHVSHEDRIIPEISAGEYFDDYEAEADGDDTVDEEALEPAADADERITSRLKPPSIDDGPDPAEAASAVSNWVYPPQAAADSGRKAAASQPARPAATTQRSDRVKKITDGLSRRVKQEREETLRLIEQAESVAIKLREASEASRTDLAAISERRTEIRLRAPQVTDLHELPDEAEPDSGETVFDEVPAVVQSAPVAPAPRRPRPAERVPTRAIGEIVNDLQRTAESAPATLSALLDEVSRREAAVAAAASKKSDDDDLDLLVVASSRLRETIEAEFEADRDSGRYGEVKQPEPARKAEPEPEPRRAAAESNLSADLDRLWDVLDSRRTSRATVVLPAADKARITPREDEPLDGWTQEMLWPTLAGIAVATFILGALFVWLLVKAWA